MNEINILKFFENAPIEKAELLFGIVREKMKERIGARGQDGGESAQHGSARKRRTNEDASREEPASPGTV